MEHRRRRSKLVIVVLLLALVGITVPTWEASIDWLNTTRADDFVTLISGRELRGWKTVKRWGQNAGTKHGPQVHWATDTGLLVSKCVFRDGKRIQGTYWRADGTVISQVRMSTGTVELTVERKTSPPWWWGITDQTTPTAPWWQGGR